LQGFHGGSLAAWEEGQERAVKGRKGQSKAGESRTTFRLLEYHPRCEAASLALFCVYVVQPLSRHLLYASSFVVPFAFYLLPFAFYLLEPSAICHLPYSASMYRFKRWQWGLVGAGLLVYFTLTTLQVYGNFYLGYPPYTPAWLNYTKRPLERTLTTNKKSSLRIWGDLRQGRISLKLDGVLVREWVEDFDFRITLNAGTHQMRLEMQEATGSLQYSLE
jgi:hypothetical protein